MEGWLQTEFNAGVKWCLQGPDSLCLSSPFPLGWIYSPAKSQLLVEKQFWQLHTLFVLKFKFTQERESISHYCHDWKGIVESRTKYDGPLRSQSSVKRLAQGLPINKPYNKCKAAQGVCLFSPPQKCPKRPHVPGVFLCPTPLISAELPLRRPIYPVVQSLQVLAYAPLTSESHLSILPKVPPHFVLFLKCPQ